MPTVALQHRHCRLPGERELQDYAFDLPALQGRIAQQAHGEIPMTATSIERHVKPLPVTIEEIDRDWLTAALRTRAPGVSVRDFSIADINRGTCTKIRLGLNIDEAGNRAGIPASVILKGGFEKHSRAMYHMHETEVRAYRDVLHTLKLHSPACYFADFDPERQQGIIIIEDLVPRGVRFCNPLQPQTHDQVARRLSSLARFHARTWDSPGFASGGPWAWTKDYLGSFVIHMRQYLEPATWHRFVAAPRGAAASVRFHDRRWMGDALERLCLLSQRLPRCIVHGDTHLGNLYVDADGTPGFFDPLPYRGPALVEVAYHIAGALDSADRRRSEAALLQHYLDELGLNGVDPPRFEASLRNYGAFLAYGYCVFLINESFYQPEAINTAYTARFSAAMLDHDTIGLLQTIA